MLKQLIYISLISWLLAACNNLEQTVTPDLNQVEAKIVIEGLITNELKAQKVIVSKTAGFYTTGATEKVSNADVIVEDNDGNLFTFEESEETPGLYTAEFAGEVGKIYSLTVNVDGEFYEASEEMFRVTTIDSLTWEIDEDEKNDLEEDDDDSGEFYDVLLFTKEPPETEDYYLFKFYRNGEIDNEDNQEVYYSDDAILDEAIEGLEAVSFYALNDSITVEAYSITRQAYLFYSDMQLLLDNDGGIYGPIPANLRNNLSNDALGYFQVSAVDRESIIVGK
ncbi:DUF4249 domain-containing protein [Chondrinema litorale]|uniref:DUF4249 domain-containing protein n=1 Tax=Chondrinema litorale TaxID=2994555 RepID=UPI002542A5A7|nr:DUF4249 domain-containing protein [Chondrinema litorale]UZR93542.1 DUF4249 domain-containing protein [Chondrinema litorale]